MSDRANASWLQDGLAAHQESISDGGSTSVITYLRKEKKLQKYKEVRKCERNNSADTKFSEEGGGGGAPGAGEEISLQSMEVHGGADTHLQPTDDPMPEQVDDPGRL